MVGGQDDDAVGPVLPPDPQSDRANGSGQGHAHKLARLVDGMLKHGQEYVKESMEEYQSKMKAKLLSVLKKKATAMGYELTPPPPQ